MGYDEVTRTMMKSYDLTDEGYRRKIRVGVALGNSGKLSDLCLFERKDVKICRSSLLTIDRRRDGNLSRSNPPGEVLTDQETQFISQCMKCRPLGINQPKWRRYFSFVSVKLIIKEISLSHHVGNVFIYMATSRRFLKLTVKSLFFKSNISKADPRDTSLHTIRVGNVRNLGDGV
ncbi:hypothetical protein PoB_007116600 [Plakobranchus ocellatus]|uniref:Uncharacterized protein n=1 Tax=Plakobranchus ocellatus TaxID=259542 RepID=A0AAV4DKF3_9GAST|nr:hypothetical protein PoB_007116600 [Plakobranchus ocellatus]